MLESELKEFPVMQTLQPSSTQLFSREQFDSLTKALYEYQSVRKTVTEVVPTYGYATPNYSASYEDSKAVFDKYASIFSTYGITLVKEPTSNRFPGDKNYSTAPTARLVGNIEQILATGLGYEYGNPNYSYTRSASLFNYSLEQYRANILQGPLPRSVGGGGGVFDTLFSSGYIKLFVENPISAITGIIDRFSRPVGYYVPQFLQAAIDPPKVDFAKVGLQSGINLVSNVAFGYGVQGFQQGLAAGTSASTPLASGVYGPVSPGFWGSLGSGNFSHAWQIAQNTLGVASGGPTSFLSRQGATLLAQQAIQTFVRYTGDIGKGIVQFFGRDIGGFLETIGVIPQTPPVIGPSFLGGVGGGGGGSGLGIGTQGKAVQTTINPVWYVVGGLSVVALVIWWIRRK